MNKLCTICGEMVDVSYDDNGEEKCSVCGHHPLLTLQEASDIVNDYFFNEEDYDI